MFFYPTALAEPGLHQFGKQLFLKSAESRFPKTAETDFSDFCRNKITIYKIRDLATRINTEALNKEFKKSQELFVSAIIKNDVEAVHQYSADTYNMKAMRSIDWHSFMRAVNECNNPTACEASDAIIRLIPDTSIIGPDGRDNVIKNLLPGLSEYIKANPTKIRTTFLHELYMHLKEKCERQY